MKTFFKIAAASCLTFAAAPSAMAASFLIDDFNDLAVQLVAQNEVAPGIPPQGSQVAAPVLGGFRDLWVQTKPVNTQLGTTLSVQNGELSFNNATNQTGLGQVVYDGDDGTPTSAGDINITGLGGLDLTFGLPNAAFFFDVLRTDGDFVFRATIYDMLGNFFTYSENIFGSFSPLLSLTEFSSNGVDVTNVGAVIFEVESTTTGGAIDGALDSISVVPLPASALLLIGGLGGLFGVSAVGRRRRREEA